MKHLHGIYKLYSRTGASFIVVLVLIVAVIYSLLGPGTVKKTLPDVKIVGSQKQQNALFKTQSGGCAADSSIDSEESAFVNLLNQYRTSHGLQPVTISTKLSQMAQWTATDMTGDNNIPDHIDTLGRLTEVRAPDCGVSGFPSEILTAGLSTQTATGALQSYENSPSHNAIILDNQGPYLQIGVGHAFKAGSTYGSYWAVEFGKTDDGTNGGTGSGGGGGGITPPPATGGGSTCTCSGGTTIEGKNITADCGVKVCGTDSQNYLCESQDNWVGQGDSCQSTGACYEGQIINDVTGAVLSMHYIGYNGQSVCGINKQNFTCRDGVWTPENSSCGPNSGGSGGGITPPPGGGGTNPTIPPSNTQYTLSVTLDKTTFNPGDRINLCYNLSPQGVAYHIKLFESNLGGAFANVGETNDDGVGGGDCLFLNLDAAAVAGSRVFKVEAYINGQKVAEGSATATVNAASTTPTTIIVTAIPTGTTTETPTVIPTIPGETTTSTLAIILPGIAGNTALGENPTPISTTQTGNVEITGINQNVTFNFAPSDFTFQTQIGANSGNAIKIRTNNSLWKETNGLNIPTKLVTGDLNQDNVLDLLDYNIFLACYGSGTCSQKQIADLNLDGKVDEKDLNIFYSGLANRTGD